MYNKNVKIYLRKEMVNIKVKLFTHTDLDGIGCAILGKLTFDNIDVEYCNYDDIDEKVKDFIINQQYKDYDFVYITDISINKEVAELINNTHPDNFKEGFNLNEMFQLLDHHKTAEWLNKYWWAKVQETDTKINEKISGTRMFFNCIYDDYLKPKLESNNQLYSICEFVEIVNRYDTWLWKTKYNDRCPKQWNDLFYIYGKEKFIDKVVDILSSNKYFHFQMNATDIILLELEQEKIDRYIKNKNKEIIKQNILDCQVGIVFAEQFTSELGNKLAELNSELDFIVIINMSNSVSYRGIKDNINLGEIAKIYGGGGHPQSAGSPISDSIRQKVIDLIFG